MTATVSNDAGVALRAYFVWEDEGCPHGRHEAHWFAAEAAEPDAVVTVPAKKAAPAKVPAGKKPVQAKAAAPKAPAEAIVAAAALAVPSAAQGSTKGARRAH